MLCDRLDFTTEQDFRKQLFAFLTVCAVCRTVHHHLSLAGTAKFRYRHTNTSSVNIPALKVFTCVLNRRRCYTGLYVSVHERVFFDILLDIYIWRMGTIRYSRFNVIVCENHLKCHFVLVSFCNDVLIIIWHYSFFCQCSVCPGLCM